MARVTWQPSAISDLEDIIRHLERFDPEAPHRYGVRLYDLGNSLCDFPHRGRPCDDGTRVMTGVPPYVICYVVADDTVSILSIRHGARRPN